MVGVVARRAVRLVLTAMVTLILLPGSEAVGAALPVSASIAVGDTGHFAYDVAPRVAAALGSGAEAVESHPLAAGHAGSANMAAEDAAHLYDFQSDFVAPISALGRGDVFTAHRTGMSGLEASLDPDGILDLYIVRGSATPAGHQMFDEALEAFGDNVGGIRGSWWDTPGIDANYRQFQASIDAGLSADAAALSTFTGQNAARHGFSEVESVVNGVGEVTVVFRRGN